MSFWQTWNNTQNRNKRRTFSAARIGGMILGVLFLGLGIRNGEIAEIYRKAVMICLECIGIG